MPAIVYVLSNPAMPGLVKIGRTSRDRLQARMDELHGTGVPLPFRCECAIEVEDERGADIELALHEAFAPVRVSPSREFFQLAPDQPAALLRVVGGVDVTPQLDDAAGTADAAGERAARTFRKRGPNLNYFEMGLAVGTELTGPGGAVATVAGPRKVHFDGEEVYLTRATELALAQAEERSPGSHPSRHWMVGERSLNDLYNETYGPPG